MSAGLLHPESSALLVIDIQERLMPVIHQADRVFDNTRKLIEGARLLGVDIVATEQYPKGLGPTCAQVPLGDAPVLAKTGFSCFLQEDLGARIEGKKSLVLCGVEAHVCVLKTALDALDQGYEVHVAGDAVSSRTPDNHRYGLDRMRQSGAFIGSTEMFLFQWMDYASGDTFKAVSKLIK